MDESLFTVREVASILFSFIFINYFIIDTINCFNCLNIIHNHFQIILAAEFYDSKQSMTHSVASRMGLRVSYCLI